MCLLCVCDVFVVCVCVCVCVHVCVCVVGCCVCIVLCMCVCVCALFICCKIVCLLHILTLTYDQTDHAGIVIGVLCTGASVQNLLEQRAAMALGPDDGGSNYTSSSS
jgi:hypothetical protein